MPKFLTLLCILYFWTNGIGNLDRFPRIHEDEAWIAAPGINFWSTEHFGTFGTPLFAGFYRMEQRYYGFMPLFPLLVGFGTRIFGIGLFQIRLVPLIAALLTLALTYRIGALCFSRWHGTLAVMVLVTWKIAAPSLFFNTGIPLADMARITRYDNLVPVFGLVALLATKRRAMFTAGLSIGLATLSHIYGIFWLATLLTHKTGKYALLRLFAGLAVALLPYLLFVGTDVQSFLHQQANNAGRFQLTDVNFYQQNLSNEIQRYQPIVDALNHMGFGAWLWILLALIGVVWLLMARHGVLWLLMAQIGLFALLLKPKTFMYATTLLPLFALLVAAALCWLWRWQLIRPLLMLACSLALLEGIMSYQSVRSAASQTTPYNVFVQQIADTLPDDAYVVAVQHYWLGLTDDVRDYRSILVPMWLTNAAFVEHPVSFADALAQNPPDIILIDEVMLHFFEDENSADRPFYALTQEIQAYLQRGTLIATLSDVSYGRLLVYQFRDSE